MRTPNIKIPADLFRQLISATVAFCLGVSAFGCAASAGPPVTMRQLRQRTASGTGNVEAGVVMQVNLDRVFDDSLDNEARFASLSVLLHLDGENPDLHQTLASALRPTDRSAVFQQVLLGVLASKDYPHLASHIAMALPECSAGRIRQVLLEWLIRRPQPELLATIVRLWASENDAQAEDDDRYRRAVEAAAGCAWAEALVGGLNRDHFLAKGSALSLLTSRLGEEPTHRRLVNIDPASKAMGALQYFAREFNYVPAGEDLRAVVTAYDRWQVLLPAAAELARRWGSETGYQFHIRDIHLLRNLAQTPSRQIPGRTELIASIQDRIMAASGSAAVGGAVISHLSMADLVRLDLLWNMLNRSETRQMLRVTAQRDREDTTSAWGGLVLYLQGRAQGRLYLPGRRGDDLLYRPNERMIQDALDSLAWFHCRFAPPTSAEIGPLPYDFTQTAKLHTQGLVLSAAGGDHFTAVFYTADGAEVPLGIFPFLK